MSGKGRGPFFDWLKLAQAALRDGTINANAFAVLVVASQYADYGDGGRVHPGVDRLARETGLSPRTVGAALGTCVAAGLLEQVSRGYSNAGTGRASEYRLGKGSRSGSASAPAPAAAKNNSPTRPERPNTDMNEMVADLRRPAAQSPTSSRRVKKPVPEKLDWSLVGLTPQEARLRGLTEIDYRNFIVLRDDCSSG